MTTSIASNDFRVFTTIRRIEGVTDYTGALRSFFRTNDQYGFTGSLIFQNNTNDIEPWVIAQELLSCTASLSPFIAVNPIYMHPYTAAQKILSLTRLYNRKIYINFITGTSLSDLDAMNGLLSHEERYQRLTEYMAIVSHLLTSRVPLTNNGRYYQVKNLRLTGQLAAALTPEIYIAGSSADAGLAREKTGAGKIEMARPLAACTTRPAENVIIHFGIIAAADAATARQQLLDDYSARFPEAKELFDLSMKNTDATWKTLLKEEKEDHIYRLEPFKHFSADCPYLVGSYEQVAQYLNHYITGGRKTFIIEADHHQLESIHTVLQLLNRQPYEIIV
ncbi:MAG TPA: LLM class flavin-dependent oxidoreductase [Niastella sp.]|nr:LLM class flavin-dependent oxidoreductase [Niastella sp.]